MTLLPLLSLGDLLESPRPFSWMTLLSLVFDRFPSQFFLFVPLGSSVVSFRRYSGSFPVA
uniref:Uncharacterized protein n=1 Tax=Lotus japonicus TaxID=34305 RepID=I3SMT6_LOTJA|nr:unknown [Lotus japonicus]